MINRCKFVVGWACRRKPGWGKYFTRGEGADEVRCDFMTDPESCPFYEEEFTRPYSSYSAVHPEKFKQ